jgi:hypothetical protein
MKPKDITAIDPNFRRADLGGRELDFYDVTCAPFVLSGFAWFEEERAFCRLPQAALPKANDGVRGLAWNTAGGQVRFRTDSTVIAIIAELCSGSDMNHMPRSGSSGFDLFLGIGRQKRFIGFAIPDAGSTRVEGLLAWEDLLRDGQSVGTLRDFSLNFPLYNGVNRVSVGLAPGYRILPPSPLAVSKPIWFYGSSITQGGCASRPGNAYTNHVARWLDADHVNWGFSGSARGEPMMAELIASRPMSVFVMDYDHNAPTVDHLRQTHEPFFQIIRRARPDTPVVFVTRPDYDPGNADHDARREIVRATYEAARRRGDKRVFFVDGSTLFEDADRDACAVDRCHPNDLGFYRMARGIAPVVR